jgi:hypothetical protein
MIYEFEYWMAQNKLQVEGETYEGFSPSYSYVEPVAKK